MKSTHQIVDITFLDAYYPIRKKLIGRKGFYNSNYGKFTFWRPTYIFNNYSYKQTYLIFFDAIIKEINKP